ncbi:MAG TPA: hypothetical protein VGL81_32365 [Polyangiaceae bacterium]|jgi:hypothetical protein
MAIATDGANVYWVDQSTVPDDGNGRVLRCTTGGCNGAPETLAGRVDAGVPGLLAWAAIAVDASSVYWIDGGAIVKRAK